MNFDYMGFEEELEEEYIGLIEEEPSMILFTLEMGMFKINCEVNQN